jgi:hypothetical protein
MKEPERRSIPLNDHGLALLGEALALWPGKPGVVADIRRAQEALGVGVRSISRRDYQRKFGCVWPANLPFEPQIWDPEWTCAPEIVTARAFAWSWQDFDEFPALWAFSTKDLPEGAQRLNQATPIAKRSTWPVDDLMKSLDRWFAREIEKRTGIRVSLGTKPLRWGDSHYKALKYHRDIAPPKPKAKPGPEKGKGQYNDGLERAALMVESMLAEDRRRPGGGKLSRDEAIRKVVRHVGVVAKNHVLRCEDENGDRIWNLEPVLEPVLDEHGEPVLDEHGEPVLNEKCDPIAYIDRGPVEEGRIAIRQYLYDQTLKTGKLKGRGKTKEQLAEERLLRHMKKLSKLKKKFLKPEN